MKVIKSNGNYKLFYRGFHWIIQCHDSDKDAGNFYKLVNACKEMYGPESEWLPKPEPFGMYKHNDDWRYDINKKLKRRRLYLKNETDVTLLMLKAQ